MKMLNYFLAVALAVAPALAGAPYTLEEVSFDGGGEMELASPEYEMNFVGIAPPGAIDELTSDEYVISGGIAPIYRPAGEVGGLLLTGANSLTWDAESSAGSYNLYRGSIVGLAAGNYGSCLQTAITGTATIDSETPAPSTGVFYLVSVTNLLDEEGTTGSDSQGATRPNPVCPPEKETR